MKQSEEGILPGAASEAGFLSLLLTVLVNEQPILSEIMKYPKLNLNLFYILKTPTLLGSFFFTKKLQVFFIYSLD